MACAFLRLSHSATANSLTKDDEQNYAIFDARPLPEELLQYAVNVSRCSALLAPLPI